jgi:hypothetical protein
MAAPDPTAVATTLVTDVAGQVVSASVGIAPVAVPAMLTLAAISWALNKFGLKRKRGLTA